MRQKKMIVAGRTSRCRGRNDRKCENMEQLETKTLFTRQNFVFLCVCSSFESIVQTLIDTFLIVMQDFVLFCVCSSLESVV